MPSAADTRGTGWPSGVVDADATTAMKASTAATTPMCKAALRRPRRFPKVMEVGYSQLVMS